MNKRGSDGGGGGEIDDQSINQSRRTSMAPYVAEPFVGAEMCRIQQRSQI